MANSGSLWLRPALVTVRPHYLGQLLQITKLKSRNPGKKVKYSLKMVCDKLLRFSWDLNVGMSNWTGASYFTMNSITSVTATVNCTVYSHRKGGPRGMGHTKILSPVSDGGVEVGS